MLIFCLELADTNQTLGRYLCLSQPKHPKVRRVMKLTVKTLKGGKCTVEVEPSNTVAEAKGIIVSPAPGFIRCMSRLTVCGTD